MRLGCGGPSIAELCIACLSGAWYYFTHSTHLLLHYLSTTSCRSTATSSARTHSSSQTRAVRCCVKQLPEAPANSTTTTPRQRQIQLRAASSLEQPQPASASWQAFSGWQAIYRPYVPRRHDRHPPLRCLLWAGVRLYARQAARRREDGGHGCGDDSPAPTVHYKSSHHYLQLLPKPLSCP